MKIKFNKNILLICFFFIVVFGTGIFLLRGFFSGYLTGIRGGLIFILLTAGVLLAVISLPPQLLKRHLPHIYFIAIVWGYFYQVILLYDAPLHASFFRCLFYILLIIGMVLFLSNKKIDLKYLLLFFGWLFFNLFSLLGKKVPDDVIMLYFVGVVLPGLFALVLHVYFKTEGTFELFTRAVSLGTIGILGGMLLIMFLATVLKWGDIALARNAANLNYGAGLLFLAWPFITWKLYSHSFLSRIFIILFITAVAFFSFSRTTFFLTIMLIIFTFFISQKTNKKIIVSFLLAFLLIAIFAPQSILSHWLARFNIKQWSEILHPERWKDIALTDRAKIWSFALNAFSQSPLIGHGLGSFSTLVSEKTAGVEEYSEAHSLTLTVMAERGVIGFVMITGMILYILFNLLLRWRVESGVRKEFFILALVSFFCFLAFAHTTGAEIMRSGTLFVDGTLSAYLMVYLVITMSWSQIREKSLQHGDK
ncbi:hypothetical protein LCGC14_0818760 [marine sediment metagenome]|uniref:O-antigen ligase-related domain-containing protein n=1 Tax=marine sediment metagenome TaxID=412755 RepID=A0A0F9S4I0_9ZZZZ|nr:hypothetical protein [Candidatus Aminicenantes bacterium]HEB35580.1 hypothetical protein [Candidatus Aminicenantes bacterium]